MRFFSITAQTIDIGKDGVSEMIVFINEKINLGSLWHIPYRDIPTD